MKSFIRKWWWVLPVALVSLAWSTWQAQLPPDPERVEEELQRLCAQQGWPTEEFVLHHEEVRGDLFVRSYDYVYGHPGYKASIEITCIRGILGDDGFCTWVEQDGERL